MSSTHYAVFHSLDNPRRIIGLPIDEFLMAVVPLVLGLLMHRMFFGMLVGGITVLGMRFMKKGSGSAWLIYQLYWHGPSFLCRPIFPHVPVSSNRHYVK